MPTANSANSANPESDNSANPTAAPRPAGASSSANSANASRRASLFRDAAFVRKIKELALAGDLPGGRGGIVYISNSNPHSTNDQSTNDQTSARSAARPKAEDLDSPSDSDQALIDRLTAAILLDAGDTAIRASQGKSSKHERWYENRPLPPRAHRKPTEWPYVTAALQIQLGHYALKGRPYVGFTVHIGRDLKAEMLGRGVDAIRHMSQRLTRNLEKALGGKKIDYWFSFDKGESEDAFDHLHGELACLPDEHAKVLAALREAGGTGYGGNNKHREARALYDAVRPYVRLDTKASNPKPAVSVAGESLTLPGREVAASIETAAGDATAVQETAIADQTIAPAHVEASKSPAKRRRVPDEWDELERAAMESYHEQRGPDSGAEQALFDELSKL